MTDANPDSTAPFSSVVEPAETVAQYTELLESVHGSRMVPEADDRTYQGRLLAEELRRIVDLLVRIDAPASDLAAAAEAAGGFRERLEGLGRRDTYDEPAEASLASAEFDAGTKDRSFFENSPLMGLSNPIAPPVRFTEMYADGANSRVRAIAELSYAYEGPPANVHGGWVAAMFDEVLGLVQGLTGNPGMTGRLTISYRSPTPLATELTFAARVDRIEGRKIFATGTCHSGERLCAEAEGLFISIDASKVAAMMADRAGSDPTS